MQQPTLFDTDHDQAVYGMLALFQEQLRTAKDESEAELVRMAIRGWAGTLGDARPFAPHRKNGAATRVKHPSK